MYAYEQKEVDELRAAGRRVVVIAIPNPAALDYGFFGDGNATDAKIAQAVAARKTGALVKWDVPREPWPIIGTNATLDYMIKRGMAPTVANYRAAGIQSGNMTVSGSSFGTFLTGLALIAGVGALQAATTAAATSTATTAAATSTAKTAASVAAPVSVAPTTVAAGSMTDAAVAAGLSGAPAYSLPALGGTAGVTSTVAVAPTTFAQAVAAASQASGYSLVSSYSAAQAASALSTVSDVVQNVPTPKATTPAAPPPPTPAPTAPVVERITQAATPVLQNVGTAAAKTALGVAGSVATAKLLGSNVPNSATDGGVAAPPSGKINQPAPVSVGTLLTVAAVVGGAFLLT